MHLTAQDNVIIGRLPSSNEPVWTFNSSVAQGRVARLGVTDESSFVVVVFYAHQELWTISLPKSFTQHQQQTLSFSPNYTDCLSYFCGKCVNNQCVIANSTSGSCKNEGDCNQMITICLDGICQTMWPDCFAQCNSYWTQCYSYDCKRFAGLTCQS